MTDSNGSTSITPEQMMQLSQEFDQMCYDRHMKGKEEYGPYGFLQNDLIRMISEELADLANYARYLYMKVRLLGIEDTDVEGSTDSSTVNSTAQRSDRIHLGAAGFMPASDILGDDQEQQ